MSYRRVRTSTIVYDFELECYVWTQESGDWPMTLSWCVVPASFGWACHQLWPVR